MNLQDFVTNFTDYSGNIYIKRICNKELSKFLSMYIPSKTNYDNFKYIDKLVKSKLYNFTYKELKKLLIDNNEYKEMISDEIHNEGIKIRFILELYDREGYLERYKNNDNYPLYVISRETSQNKIKGFAIYDSDNIFLIERSL